MTDEVMEKFSARNKTVFKSIHKQWPPSHSKSTSRVIIEPRLSVVEVDYYNNQERHLSYRELCKFHKKPVKILVQGDSGVGKTTLCVTICNDWATGKQFKQFRLVIYIPLHYKKLHTVCTLQEMLKLLHPDIKEKHCSALAGDLETARSQKVLIIADGWDKLDEQERHMDSFFSKFLFGSNYSDMSVLVTVSSSCQKLMFSCKNFNQQIKMHGFNRGHIKAYINFELASGDANNLLRQLESNPLVELACSIPSICATICNMIRSTHEQDIPRTLPELYTKMVLHIISGYLKKKGAKGAMSFDHIPERLLPEWRLLCKFAFESVIKEVTTVPSTDVVAFCSHANKTKTCFGLLLQSTKFFVDTDTFCFLHSSFQCYLAARHILEQPCESQLQILRENVMRDSFKFVWRFFFGLCSMEHTLKQSIHTLYGALYRCDKLQLCHFAFEAKATDFEFVKSVTEILCSKKYLHSREATFHFGQLNTSYDCDAVINIIDNISVQNSFAVEINFSKCCLRDEQVNKLAKALSNGKVIVTGIDLGDNKLSDEAVADLFHRAPHAFQSLHKLILHRNLIECEGIKGIVDLPAKSIVYLDLSYNPLTIHGLCNLQKCVSSGKLANLETLLLRHALTGNAESNLDFLCSFSDDISSQCQELRRLDLFENDLGKTQSPAIVEIIKVLTNIRKDFDLYLNREYMSQVDEQFVTVMEESVKNKGTIKHTVVHGIIVGPGRSGKDSLMQRLITNKGPPDPNVVSPSTGVLERVVKVEVKKLCEVGCDISNITWRHLEYDEEALELIMSTAKSHSEATHESGGVNVFDSFEEAPVDGLVDYVICTGSNESSVEESISDRYKEGERRCLDMSSQTLTAGNKVIDTHEVVSEEPLDVFKKAIKLRSMDALRDHLESSWTLYLTNTGGQSEFQELLPLLVCGPSVFFITFPLDKDLDKHYTVRYQNPDGSEHKYHSPLTLMDEILQTLATIASLKNTGPKHNVKLRTKVLFVGTHKDKLPVSEAEEIIQTKENYIRAKIESTSLYLQRSVVFAAPPNKLIFSVNNLANEDEYFQNIRSAVQQCVENTVEFTIECPSAWLVFSLILRAQHKSRQVLTYSECFEIAQNCGMSDRIEMNKALFFIHTQLGLVRYFSVKELNFLVVIDPQILFTCITGIVKKTLVSACMKFHVNGIFSLDEIEGIRQDNIGASHISLEWLVNLLIYLRIAVMLDDRRCFLPFVLCHADHQSMTQVDTHSYPPLLIAFECGFCPRGVCGALITYLVSNEMHSEIEWHLRTTRISRNQVSFGVGTCDIILTMLPTHIEIKFDPLSLPHKESEVENTCVETYMQIQQALKVVRLGYNENGTNYFFAFYCSRPECRSNPHPAKINWKTDTLFCTVKQFTGQFPVKSNVWIRRTKEIVHQEDVGNRVLDFANIGVSKHLGQIADHMDMWEGRIAEELKLTPAEVACIKDKHPNKLELQKRAALEKWKQKLGDEASYNELIAVFERAGRRAIAKEIREIIKKMCTSEETADTSALSDLSPCILPCSPQPPVFPAPATTCIVYTDKEAAKKSEYPKLQDAAMSLQLSRLIKRDHLENKDEKEDHVSLKENHVHVTDKSTGDETSQMGLETTGTHKVVVDLDTFIKEVYDHLGHSWKFLARELGFSETDIAALEHDNPYLMKEQIHQMFYQWKRREGNGATSDKLLSAMKSAGGFDEQIKILTGKGMIENEKSSADLASSLAAGVRLPIQASDDTQVQTDSPVKSKLTATNAPSLSSDDVRSDGPFRSTTASPESTSTSSPRENELGTTRSSKASPTASTPPSERDFIRQQRLKRFSSSTSDRSDTNSASCSDQRVLDSPPREVAGSDRPLGGAAMRTSSATTEASSHSVGTFEVGDCIRVDRPDSAPWYGVIRWIGTLPGTSAAPLAGMEMEHAVKGGGDGSIAGVLHFTCAEGHGLFLPLSLLKRDDRFNALDNVGEVETSESSPRVERSTNPVSAPLSDLMSRLWTAGENRGTEQSDASSDSEADGSKVYELRIPADRAGLVIGAGGKNIREVERLTNTSINVDGGGMGIYGGGNRKVRVLGSEENCKKALLLILKKVERHVDEHMAGVKTISVPDRCVGKIIGKGGATISTIKSLSGAHDIKFDERKTGFEAMLQTERQCYIHGSEEAIQKAERLIRLAVKGEDIVAGATFAAIFMELGVQCQEEDS